MPTTDNTDKSIAEMLEILDNDLSRKELDTRTNYKYIARKFLTESGDFSRQGMMTWFNKSELSDNSLRTAHYALKRLCKALEIKFPLDGDDLPPPPDEETLVTPTLTIPQIRQMIRFWRTYPDAYETSLLFISTILGTRSSEMSDTQGLDVTGHSIIITVAKRKAKVIREHNIPEKYIKFTSGYQNLSENTVRYRFRKIAHWSGVKRTEDMCWHSIRRGLATTFKDMGINEFLYKRFMRWAPNREDMGSVYYHHPFELINNVMLGQAPNPETGQLIKHPFLGDWG